MMGEGAARGRDGQIACAPVLALPHPGGYAPDASLPERNPAMTIEIRYCGQ
jgi:hypothetical protein